MQQTSPPLLPLLITRERADADAAVARLRRLGVSAVAAPCIDFAADTRIPPSVANLYDHDADVLLTSPRAVRFLPRLSPMWRILALAPTTAAAARAAGLAVAATATGGAAALAARARPGPLLALTSDIGGDEVLRIRPDAILWPVYRTLCPDDLPLPDAYDVWFTSPSTVHNFWRLAPDAAPRIVYWTGDTTLAALPAGLPDVRPAPAAWIG